MRLLRRIAKLPIRLGLRSSWLRTKLVYELRERYYPELAFEIPLSHRFSCPIARADHVFSFSEIFLNEEYGEFLADHPLPRRWLDLGCHAGYFSLYLAWKLRCAGIHDFSAFLVDADPRVAAPVHELIRTNGLSDSFQFAGGLLKAGETAGNFALRGGMGSSVEVSTPSDRIAEVSAITQDEILRRFPPPYDLLKLDIEGWEFEFLEKYDRVLRASQSLLIEWHSWDREGKAEQKLIEAVKARGFMLRTIVQRRKHHTIDGRDLTTGCHLYQLAPAGFSRTAPQHAMSS